MSVVRSVRVFVEHTDPLLAAGVEATLFRATDGFEVLRHDRESQLPHWIRVSYPTAVLVADYETGVRHANDASPCGPILIVTQFDDEARIRRAVQHGIQGYLLQGCSTEDLIQAVRAVHRGATAFAPIVAAKLAESLTHQSLSDRELTVLRYVMLGLSNKDISRRMTITDGTVKTHIKAIFGKLDARNRTEAVAIARRRGLLLETVTPERIENGRTTAFHILRQA
jgi:DNA-binding NarL/FixJ family response regulator